MWWLYLADNHWINQHWWWFIVGGGILSGLKPLWTEDEDDD